MFKMSKAGEMSENRRCVFCNQVFSSKDELQAHFRRHANREIDIKGKPRLAQKKTEPERVTKISGEKSNPTVPPKGPDNAMCDVCGEHFSTVSLAISHKFRKHPESAVKHYCPHCGMMFPIKVNRDNHVQTHPSVTPKQLYPCVSCGVSFYNLGARKFHMDSAHKGSNRMINPIDTPAPSLKIVLNNAGEAYSVYYCHLCGCEYQVKYNLQKHLETRHSELERTSLPEQVVQCNLCTALFYSKRAYEAHSHHHRESDLYATNESMRQSIVQRIDQDFDRRRVPTTIERYLSASAVSSNRSATWRNIRAARRKEEALLSRPKQRQAETKELIVKINSKYVPVSSSKRSRTQTLESDCSILSTSGLNIVGGNIFDDDEEVDEFLRGENMCWGIDRESGTKKRMLNDSEEDDCEIRSLGSVNPDTVMPNPQLICSDVEDKSVASSNSDTFSEVVSKSGEGNVDGKKVLSKGIKRIRNTRTVVDKSKILSEHSAGYGTDLEEVALRSDSRNSTASHCGDSGEEELMVEQILGMRRTSRGREFLVRWKGFDPEDDTWQREETLDCVELIIDFLKNTSTVIKIERPDSTPLERLPEPQFSDVYSRKEKNQCENLTQVLNTFSSNIPSICRALFSKSLNKFHVIHSHFILVCLIS